MSTLIDYPPEIQELYDSFVGTGFNIGDHSNEQETAETFAMLFPSDDFESVAISSVAMFGEDVLGRTILPLLKYVIALVSSMSNKISSRTSRVREFNGHQNTGTSDEDKFCNTLFVTCLPLTELTSQLIAGEFVMKNLDNLPEAIINLENLTESIQLAVG